MSLSQCCLDIVMLTHTKQRSKQVSTSLGRVVRLSPVLHELLCKLDATGSTHNSNDALIGAWLHIIHSDLTRRLTPGKKSHDHIHNVNNVVYN